MKTMKTQLKCKENLRLGILVPALLDTDMNQADVRLVASDGTSVLAHKVSKRLVYLSLLVGCRLRIRDVYPGSNFFSTPDPKFSIPDPNFSIPDPHQRI
jgi:hypothetical protein